MGDIGNSKSLKSQLVYSIKRTSQGT